jgi:hypothetical protein
MNARKFLNVRVGLTVTALALSGAMVLSASCAGGGGGSGGSAGNSNGGSSGSPGGSSGSPGGSSGSPGTCSASADGVCFSAGKASGAMNGYGWIALGAQDKATSPTCAPDATDLTKTQEITKANACPPKGQAIWSSTDALCISGSIPALPASPVQADYDNNWGLEVGANASETEGDAITSAYSSMALTFNGTPTMGLRAEIHIKGDPAGTTYCYDGVTSGKSVDLTKFITACWDGTSCATSTTAGCKALTAEVAKNIDKVGIQVSATGKDITVTDLCLTGIQFKP